MDTPKIILPEAAEIITVHPTRDFSFVDELADDFYNDMKTDQCGVMRSAHTIADRDDFHFLRVDLNDAPSGVIICAAGDMHTMLRKPVRGSLAVKAMAKALDWIWANTSLPFVTGCAYSNRPDAIVFAKRAGFKVTGVENDGMTVAGKSVSRTNFILNRPEGA